MVRSTLPSAPHVGISGASLKFRAVGVLALIAIIAACADVTTSPTEAASIELNRDHAPGIVLGDSLRDVNGVAVPVRATIRNLQGAILTGAAARYVYADGSRDTSVLVDSISGYVVLVKPLDSVRVGTTATASTTVRIAARFGTSLQVFDTLFVTARPDSADRGGVTTIDTLRVALPDSSSGLARNSSAALGVTVRHIEPPAVVTNVSRWLVQYEVVQPANVTNDSTLGAYLVNDNGKASSIDTTDASGSASRYVRVRPSLFPSNSAVDSVIVRATVRFKGQDVKGSPIRISVPVKKSF